MRQLVLLGLLSAFLLTPVAVFAQAGSDCAQTSPPTCNYVPAGQTVSVMPQAFTNPTPSCNQVDNAACPAGIMVPTSSQTEWTSFVADHESCAQLSDCVTTPPPPPPSDAVGRCGTWDGYNGEVNSFNGCPPAGGSKTFCAAGTEINVHQTSGRVGTVASCSLSWTCQGTSSGENCHSSTTTDN